MSDLATCKYCRSKYEIGRGYYNTIDFCSSDCQRKYEEGVAQAEESRRRLAEGQREDIRARDEEAARAREEDREETRRFREEERERREEAREERQARTSEKDERRQRFLLNAASAGEVDEVKRALRAGLDPNFVLDGLSPLLAAVKRGELGAAKALVALGGADPNFMAGMCNPLAYALFAHNDEAIELFKTFPGFRYELFEPHLVLWLWRNVCDPKNDPDWARIKAIFADPKLYPESARAALRDLLLKDEKASQWLGICTSEAQVADCLMIDLAGEARRREAERARAEEEARAKEEAKAAAQAAKAAAEREKQRQERIASIESSIAYNRGQGRDTRWTFGMGVGAIILGMGLRKVFLIGGLLMVLGILAGIVLVGFGIFNLKRSRDEIRSCRRELDELRG